jgi:hypothetical protein
MGIKKCPKCGMHKATILFGSDKNRPDGLRPWCKECHNAGNKKWRLSRSTYYKDRHKQDPDRRKKYDQKYKDNNPGYFKNYYEANKFAFVGYVSKRRKRAACATPEWADKEKMRLIYRIASNLNRFNGYEKYHVDHIVPLQGKTVSGLHVHNNLRIIPAKKNKEKKNKWTS